MSNVKYVWAVETLRGPDKIRTVEYYQAECIRDVLTEIQTDLECEVTEVLSIIRSTGPVKTIPSSC